MPKRYPKQARDIAVSLYLEGLSVPEITRRFNEGTAGLTGKHEKPIPIAITERRVAEYVAEHKAQHGPRPKPEDQELTVDSINRVKQRALNVLAREIAHLEGLPKGRISAKQSTALRQHYATLDDMERRAEIAEKRKAKGKRGKKPGATEGKSESAIEALAQAEQEAGHPKGHREEAGEAQSQMQSQESKDTKPDIFEGVVDLTKHPDQAQVLRKLEGVHPNRGLSKEELEEIMRLRGGAALRDDGNRRAVQPDDPRIEHGDGDEDLRSQGSAVQSRAVR